MDKLVKSEIDPKRDTWVLLTMQEGVKSRRPEDVALFFRGGRLLVSFFLDIYPEKRWLHTFFRSHLPDDQPRTDGERGSNKMAIHAWLTRLRIPAPPVENSLWSGFLTVDLGDCCVIDERPKDPKKLPFYVQSFDTKTSPQQTVTTIRSVVYCINPGARTVALESEWSCMLNGNRGTECDSPPANLFETTEAMAHSFAAHVRETEERLLSKGRLIRVCDNVGVDVMRLSSLLFLHGHPSLFMWHTKGGDCDVGVLRDTRCAALKHNIMLERTESEKSEVERQDEKALNGVSVDELNPAKCTVLKWVHYWGMLNEVDV